jgi:succinate dehydrogenase / fumarate reductase cytochrome b subunit
MSPTHARPLSPHLTIWKWGPGMLVSILHRISGGALTTVGLGVLTWWLMALAGDAAAYDQFTRAVDYRLASFPIVTFVLIGLSWAFWQHLFSGLRHLVLDTGAGYELRVNKFWSWMTIAGSALATVLTWFLLLGVGR